MVRFAVQHLQKQSFSRLLGGVCDPSQAQGHVFAAFFVRQVGAAASAENDERGNRILLRQSQIRVNFAFNARMLPQIVQSLADVLVRRNPQAQVQGAFPERSAEYFDGLVADVFRALQQDFIGNTPAFEALPRKRLFKRLF